MWKWLLGNKQMAAQNRTTPVTFTSFVFLQLCVIKRPCVFFLRRGGYRCCRAGFTAKDVLANRSFSRRLSHSGLILVYIRFVFPSEGLQDFPPPRLGGSRGGGPLPEELKRELPCYFVEQAAQRRCKALITFSIPSSPSLQ